MSANDESGPPLLHRSCVPSRMKSDSMQRLFQEIVKYQEATDPPGGPRTGSPTKQRHGSCVCADEPGATHGSREQSLARLEKNAPICAIGPKRRFRATWTRRVIREHG